MTLKILIPGPFLAVYCMWLSHTITCPFSKYQILYFFAQILNIFPFFVFFKNIFCLFLHFFWKMVCIPLLSRIGLVYKIDMTVSVKVLFFWMVTLQLTANELIWKMNIDWSFFLLELSIKISARAHMIHWNILKI